MTNEEKLEMFEENKTIINSKFNIERVGDGKYCLYFETDMRGRVNYRVFGIKDILEIEHVQQGDRLYAFIHWQFLN